MFVFELYVKYGMLYGCIYIVNNYIIIEMYEKNILIFVILNELVVF